MPKKCRVCKTPFNPHNSLQVVCSPKCALEIAKKQGEKKQRKETRQRKHNLKTLGQHAREAQQAFNAFIRERDAQEPCISCGRHHQGQYHAGHYRTVGACPELRFEELNVHKQCSACNNHKSGNLVEYRINLVNKIGATKVEWLEGPHEPKKYTVEQLQQIKKTYRAKARELKQKLAA